MSIRDPIAEGRCPYCGESLSKSGNCGECGESFSEPEPIPSWTCTNCGTSNIGHHCTKCGAIQPMTQPPTKPEPVPEQRFCVDDHIVNPGDGGGRWYLYDLYDHNDGPPCAEFYEREKAMELLYLLTDAATAESRVKELEGERDEALNDVMAETQMKLTAEHKIESLRERLERAREVLVHSADGINKLIEFGEKQGSEMRAYKGLLARVDAVLAEGEES